MVRKKLGNNLVRDVQSHMGRTDTSKSFDSSEYIDDVMETSSIDYVISEERKVIKNRNKQPASPSLPSVYRRRATPISDSDFEQPVDRIVKMPSKKKQLMLMKKFQPSKHILRQPSSSSEEEVDIDQDGPFFFERSISSGVGPSTITANDIFTPSPVHSARLLSPFAGDQSISPSASPIGKGKAKATFTARISSLVSSLLPSDNKKQRPPTPPLPLGQQKRSLSPSVEDKDHTNSVRIVSRQTAFPQNSELIRANAENLRLQLQLDSLTKQNAELLQTISSQSIKIDHQASEMTKLRTSMTNLDNNLKTMAQQYTLLAGKLQTVPVTITETTNIPSRRSDNNMDMDFPSENSIHAPVHEEVTDDIPSVKDSMHAPTELADVTTSSDRPWNQVAIAKLNGQATVPRFPPPMPAPKSKQQQQQQPQQPQQPRQQPPRQQQQQQQPRQQPRQQQQQQQQKKSYADIAKKITGDKPEANVMAAKSALAFLHHRRPNNISRTEQRMNVRRIYVNGIPRTTYKTLKKHLFSLHFMLSKIHNVSYIAQNCVEFLVNEEYAQSFLNRCRECNLRTIEVDPIKPLDPNFPAENLPAVKQLFAQRVARIIDNTNNDLVKSFFIEYAKERSISIPSDNDPSDPSATVPSDSIVSTDTPSTPAHVDSTMGEASADTPNNNPSALTANANPSDQ
jgi:hypothetical protein